MAAERTARSEETMTTTNRLRQRAATEACFGAWCTTPSSLTAEVLAGEGFDYVCVDCQHGLIHYDAMWPMLQAMRYADTTPIVRIPFNDPPWFGKALDAGAEGMIVPMVNSRADAERAVAGTRYPPLGVRSFGPVRSGMVVGADPDEVNREVLCIVMIETAEAVDRADQICSTPGVDGIYIGPADLAISLGVGVAKMFEAQVHVDAIDHVRETATANGIIPGIHTGGGTQARGFADAGFRMCTLASDVTWLRQSAQAELLAARGGRHEDGGGIYG
jgi:4-hydroxy-2-oxoheptanedioate aldolase